MEDTVLLERVIRGELPFTLNLPESTYPVLLDDSLYSIEVLQNRIAVADGPDAMRIGTHQDLQSHFGDHWTSLYKHELRTIVRHREMTNVPRNSLPVPTDEQLFVGAQQYLPRQNPDASGGSHELQQQARLWLNEIPDEDRKLFIEDTSVRLALAAAFLHRNVDTFCKAVNMLIRLYMTTFSDPFVQEVNQSMFSGTAFRGIHSAVFCDGLMYDHTRYAGGRFPFIIRRPWRQHPDQAVAAFRARLETTPSPDPVVLLNLRAQSLLLRGGFRSAMIEASAAFDLCLVRKIREGLSAKKSDAEIDQILKNVPRLDDRAKRILVEATGKSVPELDNALWAKFLKDRAHRGSVAHSQAEPTEAEATSAVETMMKLTAMVDGLLT